MAVEQWRKWKHITKLDPDKKITPSVIETIIETKTDAVMISGTLGVTKEKVLKLIKMLKDYNIPKILEPASPHAMVYKDVDWIFVPSIFNTKDFKYINGLHKSWVTKDMKNINWDIVVPEAYIILNPKCSAAKVTNALPIKKEEAVAAAVCAERFFNFPIIYIEYSGMYGDPELVKAVKESLKNAHLLYGGGINTKERAEEMSNYASIVVGNTIYENGAESFVNTMKGTLLQELKNIQDKLSNLKKIKTEDKARGKSTFEQFSEYFKKTPEKQVQTKKKGKKTEKKK
ncbi:MAG: heptaprenylglyceryl phosphate synthase [Candidatus Aenigmarchaeota archaeon]|nr:heptaprenylglyceryl phosphate synthase [Candidatus Aenigmarchaeota archaeon]